MIVPTKCLNSCSLFIYFFRYFNEFLLAHTRETANQIREEYVDTLSKIYYSYFKDYYNKLMKLQVREREREREKESEEREDEGREGESEREIWVGKSFEDSKLSDL